MIEYVTDLQWLNWMHCVDNIPDMDQSKNNKDEHSR
jgi:hypothetical protein